MVDIMLIKSPRQMQEGFPLSAGGPVCGPPVQHHRLLCSAPGAQLPAADGAPAVRSDYNVTLWRTFVLTQTAVAAGVPVRRPPVQHHRLRDGVPGAQLPAADGAPAVRSDYNISLWRATLCPNANSCGHRCTSASTTGTTSSTARRCAWCTTASRRRSASSAVTHSTTRPCRCSRAASIDAGTPSASPSPAHASVAAETQMQCC